MQRMAVQFSFILPLINDLSLIWHLGSHTPNVFPLKNPHFAMYYYSTWQMRHDLRRMCVILSYVLFCLMLHNYWDASKVICFNICKLLSFIIWRFIEHHVSYTIYQNDLNFSSIWIHKKWFIIYNDIFIQNTI